MKVRISLLLLVQSVALLSAPLHAADLNALAAEAAQYESGQSAEALREIGQRLCESVDNAAQRQELEQVLIRLLLPSASFEARRFACQQLASYGGEASLPALAALLKSSDTVGMACLALSTHLSAKANEVLREALTATSGPDRVQVIVALGERRDAPSVPTLMKLARDADSATAVTAIAALGKIAGEEALRSLSSWRRLNDPQRAHAAVMASLAAADRAAEAGSISEATEVYGELLASSQLLHVRRAALEGVLRIDADPRIRDAALRTLVTWPDAASWDQLAQAYRQSAVPRERRLALQGLVGLGHKENNSPTAGLIDRYRELLQHARNNAELKLILSALAGCAHPDALTLVLPLRANAQVKAEAEMAIRKIAEAIKDKHPEAVQTALQQLK